MEVDLKVKLKCGTKQDFRNVQVKIAEDGISVLSSTVRNLNDEPHSYSLSHVEWIRIKGRKIKRSKNGFSPKKMRRVAEMCGDIVIE